MLYIGSRRSVSRPRINSAINYHFKVVDRLKELGYRGKILEKCQDAGIMTI